MTTDALLKAHPSAVLVGASVLHGVGWITQIPQRVTVAVLSQARYVVDINGVDIVGRPHSWYAAIHGRLSDDDNLAAYGLPALTPALALADAYAFRDRWIPDPDDLYLDDADLVEIAEACRILGVPVPDLRLATAR